MVFGSPLPPLLLLLFFSLSLSLCPLHTLSDMLHGLDGIKDAKEEEQRRDFAEGKKKKKKKNTAKRTMPSPKQPATASQAKQTHGRHVGVNRVGVEWDNERDEGEEIGREREREIENVLWALGRVARNTEQKQ